MILLIIALLLQDASWWYINLMVYHGVSGQHDVVPIRYEGIKVP